MNSISDLFQTPNYFVKLLRRCALVTLGYYLSRVPQVIVYGCTSRASAKGSFYLNQLRRIHILPLLKRPNPINEKQQSFAFNGNPGRLSRRSQAESPIFNALFRHYPAVWCRSSRSRSSSVAI